MATAKVVKPKLTPEEKQTAGKLEVAGSSAEAQLVSAIAGLGKEYEEWALMVARSVGNVKTQAKRCSPEAFTHLFTFANQLCFIHSNVNKLQRAEPMIGHDDADRNQFLALETAVLEELGQLMVASCTRQGDAADADRS